MKTSTAVILATLLLCVTLLIGAAILRPQEVHHNPCNLNPNGPACRAHNLER